jgi:hypothetical protein
MKFIEHRIADKRVLRLIQKWLAAGDGSGNVDRDNAGHTSRSDDLAAAGERVVLRAPVVGSASQPWDELRGR